MDAETRLKDRIDELERQLYKITRQRDEAVALARREKSRFDDAIDAIRFVPTAELRRAIWEDGDADWDAAVDAVRARLLAAAEDVS